jgi:hypothetical protein
VNLQDLTTKQLKVALPELKRNPEVTAITYGGAGKYLQVGTVAVQSAYLATAKGPMVLSRQRPLSEKCRAERPR